MKKKQLMIFGILIIAVIVGACFAASMMNPEPTKTNWVGISLHSLSANEAKLVNESGASWIRVDASEDLEVAVKNAKAYNLKVLGILGSWMVNKSMAFTLEDWRGNVTHYVLQYADFVDAWEIWNEPAHPIYTLSVEKYYSMVQIASPIIRQYDPSAKIVLFGGLNLWSGGDPHLALDKEFARQLAALNVGQYGDAISVHAYPWMDQVKPLVWEKYTQSLAYYRGLFTNKSLEVWVTETGQSIEAGGEDGQAQYMADTVEFFKGKVTRLFWYSLLDNINLDQKSFGLVGNETRLAYHTLQEQLNGT